MRAVVFAVVLAGCARPPALQPLDAFDASFDAARGQRRLLALVSPS